MQSAEATGASGRPSAEAPNNPGGSVFYHVCHETVYSYRVPVDVSYQVLNLMPRDCPHQQRWSSQIMVRPTPEMRHDERDYFRNPVTYLVLQQRHYELVIRAESRLAVSPPRIGDWSASTSWEQVPSLLAADLSSTGLDTFQYMFPSPQTGAGAAVVAYARDSFPPGRSVLDGTRDLTRRINSDFEYDPTATTVTTPVDDVMALRRGVCQDFAHLQIACLRALGLPARYVSGYLLTHPPEGHEKLVGADASHAWIGVWCPVNGWVDFDPTNDMVVGDEHITLAWGRDYGDVSPVNGVIYGGGDHTISVAVDVQRLAHGTIDGHL